MGGVREQPKWKLKARFRFVISARDKRPARPRKRGSEIIIFFL